MSRRKPKKAKRKKLAPCLYWQHGAAYFVKKKVWTQVATTEAAAYQWYAKHINNKNRVITMNVLFDRFIYDVLPGSDLSPRSKTLYTNAIEKRLRTYFGDSLPDQIKAAHAYEYLDLRGKLSKHQANLEIAVLSMVLSLAAGRWDIIKFNPLHRLKKLKTLTRGRHVTDAEFDAVHNQAPPIVQAAMRIAAATGLRLGDLLALRQDQIHNDGIHVTPTKTATTSGKSIVIRWSDYLVQACWDALHAPRDLESDTWLLADKAGKRYNIGTFSHHFHAAVMAAVEAGTLTEPFRFHDLRAMAAHKAKEPTKLLGHASAATTLKHYLRAPTETDPAR